MTTGTKLKFSEFVDIVLARLYERQQTGDPGKLFDLNAIARDLKDPVPPSWVFDAGKVLETRGWAQVAFTFGGGCHARLTGEGMWFVERGATDVIARYRAAPQTYIEISGHGNQVAVGGEGASISQTIENERQPAFALLRQIRATLESDVELGEAERADLLADVATIEQQLRKREPNRSVIAEILEPLSRVASVGGFVTDLIRLFNP